MDVVILCGGQGARMREETEYRPKPMVEVGSRPLLWHIMRLFGHHGLNRFVRQQGWLAPRPDCPRSRVGPPWKPSHACFFKSLIWVVNEQWTATR